MLSRPGVLPDFNFLMTASSSSTVKSDDRLALAVSALEGEVLHATSSLRSLCLHEEVSVILKLRSNDICSHWAPRVRRASNC